MDGRRPAGGAEGRTSRGDHPRLRGPALPEDEPPPLQELRQILGEAARSKRTVLIADDPNRGPGYEILDVRWPKPESEALLR